MKARRCLHSTDGAHSVGIAWEISPPHQHWCPNHCIWAPTHLFLVPASPPYLPQPAHSWSPSRAISKGLSTAVPRLHAVIPWLFVLGCVIPLLGSAPPAAGASADVLQSPARAQGRLLLLASCPSIPPSSTSMPQHLIKKTPKHIIPNLPILPPPPSAFLGSVPP